MIALNLVIDTTVNTEYMNDEKEAFVSFHASVWSGKFLEILQSLLITNLAFTHCVEKISEL